MTGRVSDWLVELLVGGRALKSCLNPAVTSILVMGLEPYIPRTGKVVECVTSLENLQAKIALVCKT